MTTIDFYLYRIKFIYPEQRSYLDDNISRQELFQGIVNERPTVVLRARYNWHVGNLRNIDKNGGHFAVGRTTKATLPNFDETTKNFVDIPTVASPYTHVLFDSCIGFVAIAENADLSPHTSGISRAIMRLFQNANIVIKNRVHILVEPIANPRDFIESIRSAYAIRLFEIVLSRPNPDDVEESLQKPVEKYIEKANAEKGKVGVYGKELDSDTIAHVTESVAASGNDAKASIRDDINSRFHTVRLKDNPAVISVDENMDMKETLVQTRLLYKNIRGKSNDLSDN
jgi:hypothetical protein